MLLNWFLYVHLFSSFWRITYVRNTKENEIKIIWWDSWLLIILGFRQSLFTHIPQKWSASVFYPFGWMGGLVFLQPDTAIIVFTYDLSGSYVAQGWPTLAISGLWHKICNTRSHAFQQRDTVRWGLATPDSATNYFNFNLSKNFYFTENEVWAASFRC